MLYEYDFVKVVQADEEHKDFIGAIGFINIADYDYEYPYEVVFQDKKLREKSEELGSLLWKEEQLEVL